MQVEIRGIIQFENHGHKYVDVMVVEDRPDNYVTHHVGVDIEVNRGKILKFLASMYGVRPGDIAWPAHIRLKQGDIGVSDAL